MHIGKIETYLDEIVFEILDIKNPEINEIRTNIIKLLLEKYPDREFDYSDHNKEWEGIATMNFKNFVAHDGHDYYDNDELRYLVLIGCKITNKR